MTNDNDCGQIVYSASTTSGYDPFTAGHAVIDNNVGVLTFNDFHNYSEGMMKVQVEIKSSHNLTVAAYTIPFDIEVIDCQSHDIIVYEPDKCPIAQTFSNFP